MRPLLQIEKLTLSIGGKELVSELSFSINPGETVALVGQSGSGKSVTAQSILLPNAHKKGSIFFQGEDLLKKSEKEMRTIRGGKVGMIFQDPAASLNPTMKIGLQIVEGIRLHLGLSHREAAQKAIQLLQQVGIPHPTLSFEHFPHQLSGGMRQRVMIAMAIACNPLLIIADEPTTALDPTIQAEILDLLKKIQKERSLALLFITHDLGVVARISDRVLVMKEGKIVESGTTQQLFETPQHPFTKELFRKQEYPNKKPLKKQKELLTLSQVGKRYNTLQALAPVNLTLYQGETFSLVGESGSGKSTLGKIAAGLLEPTVGTLYYHQQQLIFDKHVRRRIQILFQNPNGSLNPRMRVDQILAEPFLIHSNIEKIEPCTLLEWVGLTEEYLKRYPHQLSGGQCQRIALARALAVDPELLILDEPLSALDAFTQKQILDLLQSIKEKKQLTYLFISHDLATVKEISDRIAVLYMGELVELTTPDNFNHPYTKELFDSTLGSFNHQKK